MAREQRGAGIRVVQAGTHALPGPPPRALVGDRGYAWTFDRHPLRYLQARYERYGPISGLAAGDSRLVFALGAAPNAELRDQPRLFAAADTAAHLDEPRITTIRRLIAAGRDERSSAALLHAALAQLRQPAAAAAYTAVAVELSQRTIERWGLGQQVDLVYLARRLNLGILLSQLFGIDTAATPARERLLADWSQALGASAGLSHLSRRGHARSLRLVEQLAELQSTATGQARVAALADLYAAQRDGDSARVAELAALIWELVRAAEAPLTSALSWTLLLLAQHPRALGDVQAELRYASGAATPTLQPHGAGATRLPLLERVIKESLRLLPPQCLGLRRTMHSGELLSYAVARGTFVVHSPYLTHQLAPAFIAARRFRPERWLYIEPTPDDFLPLGLPGDSALTLDFLLEHLTPVLATVLQRSRLVLAAGAQIDYQLHPVLQPRGELPMIVAPLDRKLIQREVKGSICELVDFGPG